MAHRLSHIIPIFGPYMAHTTQFGKGSNPATGTFAWVGVENAESYEMISGGIHVSLHGVIC